MDWPPLAQAPREQRQALPRSLPPVPRDEPQGLLKECTLAGCLGGIIIMYLHFKRVPADVDSSVSSAERTAGN